MKVTFTEPPRIWHHPPHLDGKDYTLGWESRKAGRPEPARVSPSWSAGWFDADNAIRLGRDIGQNEGSKHGRE